MSYDPPQPIADKFDLADFDCGNSSLNNWLRNNALKNQKQGASRTYVICAQNNVVGYYCLAAGSVIRAEAPGKIRRNMSDPIPVMIIGRLAVDKQHQGRGIGMGLIKDAVLRIIQTADIVGIRTILVHALDEKAKKFYLDKCGFIASPIRPLTLMITLTDAKKNLQ
ncbi:MAG: GNAT family N-acetyltransferase [Cyanobacteria bacterium J06600_6]